MMKHLTSTVIVLEVSRETSGNNKYVNNMNAKMYSGTSLLRSPTGLGKRDLNAEVTLLQGVICTVECNLGLNQGDCNWEVFLLVR